MDPLAQLQDIVLPEQVDQWPLAYGWWVLISLILLAFVLIVVWQIKRFQSRKVQRQAITAVNSAESTEEIINVIKWAAMTSYSRSALASLSGEDLKNTLQTMLANNKQSKFKSLADFDWQSYYQADGENNTEKLKLAVTYWLTHALPVKPKHVENNFSAREVK